MDASYEKALQAIRQAKEENAQTLDLIAYQLTVLPKEIAELKNLQMLNLGGNQITALPKEIAELKNLQILYLDGNQLTVLPKEIAELKNLQMLNLSNNQLTGLPKEVAELKNLQTLILYGNQLTALPKEVAELKNLPTLDFGGNELTALPKEIAELKNLQILYLDDNKLTVLPKEIAELKNLQTLNLGANKLTALPKEIAELKNLQTLNLGANQLTALPKEIAELKNLKPNKGKEDWEKGLSLRGNPFPFQIPDEVFEEDPEVLLKTILDLQEAHRAGALVKLNELKVILLGDGEAGKSALVERLMHDRWSGKKSATQGIDIWKWRPEEVQFNIWDFGGQEIMLALHQFFMTDRTLYILAVNARANNQNDDQTDNWLNLIKTYGKDSPVIVAYTKIDDNGESFKLAENELQQAYPKNIVEFIRTSSCERIGIDELKTCITETLQSPELKHVRDDLPKNWIAVKEAVEARQKDRDYLNLNEYYAICNANGCTDNDTQLRLLDLLQILGIVYNYGKRDEPSQTNVLKPEWVTKGIYAIINNNTLFQNKGKLHPRDLPDILQSAGNYKDKYHVITGLMEQFELCYQLDKEHFLVPSLLPKDEPPLLDEHFTEGLRLQYAYEFLPDSLMPRFITRMRQYNQSYWLKGVIIKKDNTQALIKADTRQRKILITVTGEGRKRATLDIIRHEIDDLNTELKGTKHEILVPIPGYPEATPFRFDRLLLLDEMGVQEELHEDLKMKFPVKELLDGIMPEAERERRRNAGKETGSLRGRYGGGQMEEENFAFEPKKPDLAPTNNLNMNKTKIALGLIAAAILVFVVYQMFSAKRPSELGVSKDGFSLKTGEEPNPATSTEKVAEISTLTVIGSIKINGKNIAAHDVARVYVKGNNLVQPVLPSNNQFRLQGVPSPKDNLIEIALDFKNGLSAAQMLPLPKPQNGVADLGELLITFQPPTGGQKGKNAPPTIIINNQNIQNSEQSQ